jgi:hypothetical protein
MAIDAYTFFFNKKGGTSTQNGSIDYTVKNISDYAESHRDGVSAA